MEFDPIPYNWIAGLVSWLLVTGVITFVVLMVSLLTVLVSYGTKGPRLLFEHLAAGIIDLISLSPRRIWALGQLTLRESIRRRALLVFVVFGVLFMFAGWFFQGATPRPESEVKMYTDFALRTISWLVLPVVLLLSCWGLPEDIRLRSLHTVVTKPVRRLEVVLGRMLGFGLIGTLIVVIMGGVGYVWIVRQVSPAGEAQLISRRPVFGKLDFLDREGVAAARGINTGDLWDFRSYIEGATKARATWHFTNLQDYAFTPEGGLKLENRFLGFRAHKGKMDRSLLYQTTLINPETNARVSVPLQQINEFRDRPEEIPPELPTVVDGVEKKVNLRKDLVTADGRLDIEVSCVDPGQYIGMARPDLFIRTRDLPFAAGFFKAVFGIELMMLLVVCLSVTASTFLKGPVAGLLVFCLYIVGDWAREFLDKFILSHLVNGTNEGGGVLESIYRIYYHMNPTTELPAGPAITIMKYIDLMVAKFVVLISSIIPNFQTFSVGGKYVLAGFDVPFDSSILPSLCTAVGFFIPCVVLGYYSLRLRELEAK